jgi:hypothetical protein
VSVGWWFGTPRYKPLYEVAITGASVAGR